MWDDLRMKILVAGLSPLGQLMSSAGLIWWPYLLSAFVIALVTYWLAHGRATSALREFRRRFLSRQIWLHRSARGDYAFYVVNGILYPLMVTPVVLGGATIGTMVQRGLDTAVGGPADPVANAVVLRLVFTIAFFIAYDFGRFVAHSLLHDVPLLWHFHKLHHSAEVLTPFTSYRIHPVDLFVMQIVPNATTGVVSGIVWHAAGGQVGFYTFFGLHAGIALFNMIGNLRHWQVWISFGPVLNRWLISPAHHQIHHSAEARHFGTNRGFELAIWDRMFGTLYVPVAEERFALGLGDGSDGTWHSLGAMYLRPFRDAIAEWRRRPRPASVPVIAARRRVLGLGLAGAGAALLPIRPAEAAAAAPVFLEDLTWVEVRDAVAAGHRTVLVPTGGLEQNGPHMVLGKHNLLVRCTAGEIATRLGNALVAPVIPYVPEGRFDPPEGHLRFPGTVGVSEATFDGVLRDTAASLALAGFTCICFLGDHGGSQPTQERVAAELTAAWRRRGVRVANLLNYYAANGQEAWLKQEGYAAAEIGTHAGLLDTAELLAVAPAGVRTARLSSADAPPASGVAGDPSRASAALGRHLLELKIGAALAQIRNIQV